MSWSLPLSLHSHHFCSHTHISMQWQPATAIKSLQQRQRQQYSLQYYDHNTATSLSSRDKCRTAPCTQWPQTKLTDLHCESMKGCYHLHQPSLFIINQSQSWYMYIVVTVQACAQPVSNTGPCSVFWYMYILVIVQACALPVSNTGPCKLVCFAVKIKLTSVWLGVNPDTSATVDK